MIADRIHRERDTITGLINHIQNLNAVGSDDVRMAEKLADDINFHQIAHNQLVWLLIPAMDKKDGLFANGVNILDKDMLLEIYDETIMQYHN